MSGEVLGFEYFVVTSAGTTIQKKMVKKMWKKCAKVFYGLAHALPTFVYNVGSACTTYNK